MSTDITTEGPVSRNGSTPATAATNGPPTAVPAAADAIDILRKKPRNLHLAGGLGPLIIGAVFFVLMLFVAPSVAPEHVVQRPKTTPTTAVTSTTAPPTTVSQP
jgi:hypothetical protein